MTLKNNVLHIKQCLLFFGKALLSRLFSEFLRYETVCVYILLLFPPSMLLSLCCGLSTLPPCTVLGCQVTARYLEEERIFSAVLDLPFLLAPMGRGGVAPLLIGLV